MARLMLLVITATRAFYFSQPPVRTTLRAEKECVEATTKAKHKDPVSNTDDALSRGFLMKTRALRGEYDPDDRSIDNERSGQIILSALGDFPMRYKFTAVGKVPDGNNPDALVESLVDVVRTESGDDDVDYVVTPRLNGRYLSVRLECQVQSSAMVQLVLEKLQSQADISMAF